MRWPILALITMVAVSGAAPTTRAVPAGHVTGVGGVFVSSPNPKALAAWYQDVLGIRLEPWGGAALR